jgi:hypothetical protein
LDGSGPSLAGGANQRGASLPSLGVLSPWHADIILPHSSDMPETGAREGQHEPWPPIRRRAESAGLSLAVWLALGGRRPSGPMAGRALAVACLEPSPGFGQRTP